MSVYSSLPCVGGLIAFRKTSVSIRVWRIVKGSGGQVRLVLGSCWGPGADAICFRVRTPEGN